MQLRKRFISILFLVFLLVTFIPQVGFSAERDTQQWTVFQYSFPKKSDSRWTFGVWNQVQFNDDVGRLNWLQVSPQVHYKLDDGWQVGGGFLYISKNNAADEQIPWQEISYTKKFDSDVTLGNRFRLEERMINGVSGVVFRGRYQIRAAYPLGGTDYYLTGFDQLWINLNEQSSGPTSGFDQNRLFGGVGITAGSNWRMEAGYQWRYLDNNRSGETNSDHVLLLQFFYAKKQ